MEARVRLDEGMRFLGRADSGHEVVMDTIEANGGADGGVRPNELLLIGLGGCTGMDVISILRKKRQQVSGLEVVVRADLAPSPPKRFSGFTIEYRVRGRDLDPAAVARAIELSETSYCSVGLTLRQPVAITSTYTLLPEEG